MTCHVVVPVRNQLALTASLCDQLADQPGWERTWIFDNGSTDDTAEHLARLCEHDGRFRRVDAAGMGIYPMWICGIERARRAGADHVAILNNDIVLGPGLLERLSALLDADEAHWLAYPDWSRSVAEGVAEPEIRYTTGSARHLGMCGWAFMVKAAPLDWEPLIDSRLHWWGGDDDLAFEIEARGGLQVRAVGMPVDHLGGQTSADHPDLTARQHDDLALVVEKWGR